MEYISSKNTVLVAGAGPTGLALAIALKRHGVACRVIDRAAAPARESRALGIQPRTLEVLAGLGLVDEFLSRGKRIRGAHIYSGGKPVGRILFEGLETAYPFMLAIPQSETEEILGRGVSVEREVTLAGFTQNSEGVTARLEHADGTVENADFTWLAGCDGAHSITRKSAGIGFEGEEFPQAWILADVQIDWELPDDEFQIFFHPDGPFATFGFGGNRYRIIAGDPPSGISDPPTLADVQALAEKRGWPGMRVSDPRWITGFRIHNRMVSTFRKDRIFLLGDAAHIHSPAGGQGMNTGIQDACNLAWKLGLVEAGAGGGALLDSFDAERRPVARGVLEGTMMLTKMAATHNRFVEWMRDHLVPVIASVANHALAENIGQLAVNYRHSPIVEDHHVHGGGPHAGERWPVVLPDASHTLMLPRGVDPGHRLRPYAPYLTVREGSAEHPAVYLIRPDGYVGFRGDVEALFAYLARLLPHVKL